MTPQEIQYAKENTTMLSLFIHFIEFLNSESEEEKDKTD